ncbi:site-specific recombinase, phage integrase family [Ancylostoma caninum]|uniref:Site-specific recombinase, phage integrase family n=1 Tax=Ancylostoma caninum TaxID=29170 RepID=A0A368FS92_ANCCA|nr:site-specific recombinase, phage integrase family [Ancylostoma caninum]
MSYASVSLLRSAICTVTDLVFNENWSSDPLIARFLKGFYRKTPSKPKYASTWDLERVLVYITNLDSNQTQSLKMLSLKLVALLALCWPKRLSEIAALSLTFLDRGEGRWTLYIDYRNKNRQSGAPQTAVCERFPDDPRLYIQTLVAYLETESIRKGKNRLLISYSRPHRAITASTVGWWIKWVLREAGVDTSFTAHSTRSASTSKAMREGVSLALIMNGLRRTTPSRNFTAGRFDSDHTSRSRKTAGDKEQAKSTSAPAEDAAVKQ